MFELVDFAQMINDNVRIRAYSEALRRVVHPESIVVDIGAGTGIFSLLACQFGAQHVYAIDPIPWLRIGKITAKANGYADRITFMQKMSMEVTLPEQADIIVSELRSRHPFAPINIPTLNDARRRFLKPGGLFIPQRDVVYASLLSAPALYQKQVLTPWAKNDYGLDLSAALSFSRNSLQTVGARYLSEPLLPPQVWADFDYSTHEDPNAYAQMEWVAHESATAHFILIWFDSYLLEDVVFTTAPWKERAELYACDLLPLEHPLEIAPTDRIRLDLKANLVGNEYIFRWDTSLQDKAGHDKAGFKQSTFNGKMLVGFDRHASKLNPQGKVTRLILNGLDEGASEDEIALKLISRFPENYNVLEDARAQVIEVNLLYKA